MIPSKKLYPTILLVVALIFFFVYMFSYPRTSSIDSLYGFNDANNNLNLFFARQYAETGSFKYPVPYNGLLPRDIELAFTPRDAAQFDGYIVPKFFLGALVCWGTIASIDENILLIITPLMAVFIVLALYLITRRFFDEKIALITSAIAFVFPVLCIWGVQIAHTQIPATLYLLLGFFYFLKLSESRERKYYFLSALFLASSIFCRYEGILLILPFLFYAMFLNRSIALNKRSLITIATVVSSLVPILLLNKELYGGFLVTGYQVEADMVAEATGCSGMSYFFGFEPAFIYKYMEMYIVRLAPLLTLGFILGLFATFKGKSKSKYLGSYALYVVIISSIYYGSDITYGFYKYFVNSAFGVHLLNGYLLMMPFFAVAIWEVKKRSKTVGICLLSIFVVTCIITGFAGPGGIMQKFDAVQEHREFHDLVIQKTEPDATIIVRYYGKFLSPDRNTLYAPVLAPPPPESINPEKYRLPDIKPDSYVLGHKAAYIANQGIPVYVTEIDYDNLHDFKQVLLQEGYTVEALGMKPHKEVYKIVKRSKIRRYMFPFVLK